MSISSENRRHSGVDSNLAAINSGYGFWIPVCTEMTAEMDWRVVWGGVQKSDYWLKV
jgi:hypothetical protein